MSKIQCHCLLPLHLINILDKIYEQQPQGRGQVEQKHIFKEAKNVSEENCWLDAKLNLSMMGLQLWVRQRHHSIMTPYRKELHRSKCANNLCK